MSACCNHNCNQGRDCPLRNAAPTSKVFDDGFDHSRQHFAVGQDVAVRVDGVRYVGTITDVEATFGGWVYGFKPFGLSGSRAFMGDEIEAIA
jgi:hypothetical protein